MLAIIIVILTIVLCFTHFYLKCSALVSFVTFAASIFGLILAFNYYELVAELLISRGKMISYANSLSFFLLFALGLAVPRVLIDFTIRGDLDMGPLSTKVSAVVFSLMTAVVISGSLLIVVGMAPVGHKMPYSRFEDGAVTAGSLADPSGSLLNVDGIVTRLFGWMSKGSLSSAKPFSVLHADFLNQIHLSTLKTKDENSPVLSIASKDAKNCR